MGFRDVDARLITSETREIQHLANRFEDEPLSQGARPSKSEGGASRKTHPSMRLHDTQTGMLLGMPRSARCVQRFDDSLNSAIHITFRAFAAFFIDAKAKRSVVESCISLSINPTRVLQKGRFSKRENGEVPSRVHGVFES